MTQYTAENDEPPVPDRSSREYKNWYARQWRKANAEKMAAQPSRSAEAIRAYSRAYRARHPEKARAKKPSKQDPVKHRAAEARWRAENPERYRAIKRRAADRRRARVAGAEYENYSEATVLELFGTDCHICSEPIDLMAARKCGSPGWRRSLWLDHVVPIARGGSDTLANVRPSHGECNLRKNAR